MSREKRARVRKHPAELNVNGNSDLSHEGRISALKADIANPKPQTESGEDLGNKRKRDSGRALSSSTMSEGSASSDKPDTSFALDEDIESLFG